MVEEQLVERVDELRLAVQIEPELVNRLVVLGQTVAELGEPLFGRAPQLDPELRLGPPATRVDGILGAELRALDLDRPEGHGIARAKPARRALDRPRVERRFALDRVAGGHLPLRLVERELHDRHRRHRREVVRVEDVEQRLGDFGELVVDLQVDATGEKRERFDHALDVRILALVVLEQQPPGDLRVLVGELRPHLPKKAELALVVIE